jgi:predicted Fe-Mo cluster-binding NifX family protein
MRLCIPSNSSGGLNDQVGYHFGRVPNYTIFDDETEKFEIIPNTSSHMGGMGLPAELLRKHRVDVMICGGLGHRAILLFEQYGIEVYIGAQGTIKNAIEQYKSNSLQMATDKDACEQHKFRGEGIGEHHGHQY